jgi:hypothetical protein
MSNVTEEDTAVWPHYKKLWDTIAEIDLQLDSLNDSASATRRNVVSALIEATESLWSDGAQTTIEQLRTVSNPEQLVGIVEGIIKALRDEFNEENNKIIEAKVEAAPKSEPLISQEQAEELSKQRSGLYQTIKQVVNVAKVMDDVDLEMPKTRRGSHGKRGARKMSLMVWAINGEEIDPKPKYKDLAISLGFEGSKELTAFLKSKGVDTKDPKDGKLSVEFDDGRVLSGYIPEDASSDDIEDDDDDDDDDEETEVTE